MELLQDIFSMLVHLEDKVKHIAGCVENLMDNYHPESMMEGIITIANLGGILIELNHVLYDSVSIVHLEMFKGILSISDGIKRTKVSSEFIKESSVRVLPCWWILQIWQPCMLDFYLNSVS